MSSHLSPNIAQVVEALEAAGLRTELFIERLKGLGFEQDKPFRGVLRFNGGPGVVALWPGSEGTIATCVLFNHGHHFTVGTAMLLYAALSTRDARLSENGVILAAAGLSVSGRSLPPNVARGLREEAQAVAQRSMRERIMDVVASQCYLEDVTERTQLEDACDELDMVEIVLSLEEIYGVEIDGLDDWEPFGSSEVATVGDLIEFVGPQLK
jgi:acyl carrier protein